MEPDLEAQQKAFDALKQLDIPYEVVSHPAAGTIDEIATMGILEHGEIPKNLFLRDNCGKRHLLVIIRSDKKADLKAIARQLPSSRLSFASEDRLERYLGLKKGSVTPIGVINDRQCAVEVVFDRDLQGLERVGFHPNDNHATVFLRFADICRLIEAHGKRVSFVEM